MRVVVCLAILAGQAAAKPPSVRSEIRKSALFGALSRQPLALDRQEPRVEIGEWKFPLPPLRPPPMPPAQLREATEVVATGPDSVEVADPFERPIPPTPRRDPGSPDPPENVNQVLRRNLRALLRCYQSALKINPAMQGTLRIGVRVRATGAVDSVDVEAIRGELDAGLVACLSSAIATWRMPPSSGDYDLQLPLTFTSQ